MKKSTRSKPSWLSFFTHPFRSKAVYSSKPVEAANEDVTIVNLANTNNAGGESAQGFPTCVKWLRGDTLIVATNDGKLKHFKADLSQMVQGESDGWVAAENPFDMKSQVVQCAMKGRESECKKARVVAEIAAHTRSIRYVRVKVYDHYGL